MKTTLFVSCLMGAISLGACQPHPSDDNNNPVAPPVEIDRCRLMALGEMLDREIAIDHERLLNSLSQKEGTSIVELRSRVPSAEHVAFVGCGTNSRCLASSIRGMTYALLVAISDDSARAMLKTDPMDCKGHSCFLDRAANYMVVRYLKTLGVRTFKSFEDSEKTAELISQVNQCNILSNQSASDEKKANCWIHAMGNLEVDLYQHGEQELTDQNTSNENISSAELVIRKYQSCR